MIAVIFEPFGEIIKRHDVSEFHEEILSKLIKIRNLYGHRRLGDLNIKDGILPTEATMYYEGLSIF